MLYALAQGQDAPPTLIEREGEKKKRQSESLAKIKRQLVPK